MSELTIEELQALAVTLASDRERWSPLVPREMTERAYIELLAREDVAAWLICWLPGHDTGLHDHDGSSGAVCVAQGALREDRPRLGGPAMSRNVGEGETFNFGPTDIHRVTHATGTPAVSVHAYSPPLRTMGSYLVGPQGELGRVALSSSVPLRPLGTP